MKSVRKLSMATELMRKDMPKQRQGDAALAFLDEINSLQDKLRYKYSSYTKRRNSDELAELISKTQGSVTIYLFCIERHVCPGGNLGT